MSPTRPVAIPELPVEDNLTTSHHLVVDGPNGTKRATVGQLATYITGNAGGYVHHQSTASSTWVINHGLGRRPNVAVYTEGWAEVEAEVVHTSDNQTIVQLVSPLKGFARLI